MADVLDIQRVKRELGSMIDQGASEEELDAWVSHSGLSLDDLNQQMSPAAVQAADQMSRIGKAFDGRPGGVEMNAKPWSTYDYASEAYNSVGSGLSQGVLAALGLPGTLQDLSRDAASALGRKFGSKPPNPQASMAFDKRRERIAGEVSKHSLPMFDAPDISQIFGT